MATIGETVLSAVAAHLTDLHNGVRPVRQVDVVTGNVVIQGEHIVAKAGAPSIIDSKQIICGGASHGLSYFFGIQFVVSAHVPVNGDTGHGGEIFLSQEFQILILRVAGGTDHQVQRRAVEGLAGKQVGALNVLQLFTGRGGAGIGSIVVGGFRGVWFGVGGASHHTENQ